MSIVRPKLSRSTSWHNTRALPVDGTAKNRVFSSVGLNSNETFTSGAASHTC